MGDNDKFKPDFEGLPLNPENQKQLNQREKPTGLPREGLSKRFISRKIEEMLQGEKKGDEKPPLQTPFSFEKPIEKAQHTEAGSTPDDVFSVEEVEQSDQKKINEFEDEEELISPSVDLTEDSRYSNSSFQTGTLKEKDITDKSEEWGFFRKYYLVIFLLLFIAGGWTFFFISYYGFKSKESLTATAVTIQIENLMSWRNSAPIIATPLIADANADGLLDVIWGDNLGYLRAMDPRTQELIYEPLLGAPIVASLTSVEVNGKPPMEVLVATDQGSFFTINDQGGYLYRSRAEFFNEALYGKPLILEVSDGVQVLFFTGMKGKVWAVDSRYGEVLWANENSPLALANEGIFSSPILIKHLATADELTLSAATSKNASKSGSLPSLVNRAEDYSLLVAGGKGSVAALDPATGALRWTKKFAVGFKATPLAIDIDSQEIVVLVDTNGKVLGLATGEDPNSSANIARGKVLIEKSISELPEISDSEGVVSSPVGFAERSAKELGHKVELGKNTKIILFATDAGKLIMGSFSSDAEGGYGLVLQTVYQNNGAGFIASPVIADFNQDQNNDILLISRSGKVLLLETSPVENGAGLGTAEESIKFTELTPPHELLYNTTASPVVADLNGDGQLEVVVAGENGVLTVLTLRTSPQAVFAPGTKIATQFLYNELNYR